MRATLESIGRDYLRGIPVALLSSKTWSDWLNDYAQAHQHPVNRFCHTVGVPMVATSVALAPVAVFVPGVRASAGTLFVVGWSFQFVGHFYEGKPPEFFKDPRFLFVGLRWWVEKVRGRM